MASYPSWGEVKNQPGFRDLSNDEQEYVRNRYFDDLIAPQLGESDRAVARGQFDEDTRPGRLSQMGHSLALAAEPVLNAGRRVGASTLAGAGSEAVFGLPPEGRALADAVAEKESGGRYDVVYGGRTFDDFTDHPRLSRVIDKGPNQGLTSSGAGRYQFQPKTWEGQKQKLGLADFGPENQDRAFWNLAQETYAGQTGRDLLSDLRSEGAAVLPRVTHALKGQWTSLPDGIEAGTNAGAFAARYQSALNAGGGPAAGLAQVRRLQPGAPAPGSLQGRGGALMGDAASGLEDVGYSLAMTPPEKNPLSLTNLEAAGKAGGYGLAEGGAGVVQAGMEGIHRYLTGPLTEPLGLPDPFLNSAQVYGGFRQQMKAAGEAALPKTDDPTLAGVYSGIQSLASNAAPMAAGILTGQPELALMGMAGSAGGQAFGKARDQELGFEKSLLHGGIQGGIEYFTEKMPFHVLLRDLKANAPLWKTVAHQLASEIPSEQVATVLQSIDEKAALHPEKSWSELAKELPGQMYQTAIATIVSAGVQSGAAHGLQKALDRFSGEGRAARALHQSILRTPIQTLLLSPEFKAILSTMPRTEGGLARAKLARQALADRKAQELMDLPPLAGGATGGRANRLGGAGNGEPPDGGGGGGGVRGPVPGVSWQTANPGAFGLPAGFAGQTDQPGATPIQSEGVPGVDSENPLSPGPSPTRGEGEALTPPAGVGGETLTPPAGADSGLNAVGQSALGAGSPRSPSPSPAGGEASASQPLAGLDRVRAQTGLAPNEQVDPASGEIFTADSGPSPAVNPVANLHWDAWSPETREAFLAQAGWQTPSGKPNKAARRVSVLGWDQLKATDRARLGAVLPTEAPAMAERPTAPAGADSGRDAVGQSALGAVSPLSPNPSPAGGEGDRVEPAPAPMPNAYDWNRLGRADRERLVAHGGWAEPSGQLTPFGQKLVGRKWDELSDAHQSRLSANEPHAVRQARLAEEFEQGTIKPRIDAAIQSKDVAWLRSMLGNLDNARSRAYFEQQAGVKLPKTRNATLAALDAWAGVSPEQRQQQAQAAAARNQAAADHEFEQFGEALDRIQTDGLGGTLRRFIDQRLNEGWRLDSEKVGAATRYWLLKPGSDDEGVKLFGKGWPKAAIVKGYVEGFVARQKSAPGSPRSPSPSPTRGEGDTGAMPGQAVTRPPSSQTLPVWWQGLSVEQAQAALSAAGLSPEQALTADGAGLSPWASLPVKSRKALKAWARADSDSPLSPSPSPAGEGNKSGRETVTPAEDTQIGVNRAGERLLQRKDGSRYRLRMDRADRPAGYPDFGGDLAPVEFIANSKGHEDFGTIPELSSVITPGKSHVSAPIRLEQGGDYGHDHIAPDRLSDFKENGYSSQADMLEDVAEHYTHIYEQPNGRLLLVKRNGRAKYAAVELQNQGGYYGVTTLFLEDKNPRGKPYEDRGGRQLLWPRAEATLSGANAEFPDGDNSAGSPSADAPESSSLNLTLPPNKGSNKAPDVPESDFGNTPERPADYGANNTLFTADAAEKARERLRKKLSQLNTGLDPEIVQDGITLAGYHIEAGTRAWADYSKAMLADLGEKAKPYLRSWYEGVRYYPGNKNAGEMTSAAEIERAGAALDNAPQRADTEASETLKPATPAKKRVVAKKNQENLDASTRKPEEIPAGNPDGDQPIGSNRDGNRESVDAGMAGTGEGADRAGRVSGRAEGSERTGAGRDSGEHGKLADRDREGGAGGAVTGVPVAGELIDHEIDAESIGKGGLTAKYRDNVEAIRLIKALEAENRKATPDERKQLAKYVGWGALKGVFDPNNKTWAKQHQALKALLTPEEWDSARASILNAHYTSPVIVKSIYSALSRLGFTGGHVLEPAMGSGNFFGLMPAALRNASKLHGVELDNLTSRLAKALYPNAVIAASTGFQDYSVPANYFDVAVGNPPFGSERVPTRERTDYAGFSIHNYFLARMIDKTREGGLVAAVVSHNFMDVPDSKARAWIAQRANLLGAVRLPNTAFKANAGTEVVTDIVFFQKTATPEQNPAWVESSAIDLTGKDGESHSVNVNNHFLANPRDVLGKPTAAGTMYRAGEYTVDPTGDLAEQVKTFVERLPQAVYASVERPADELNTADNTVPAGVKEGSYYVTGDGEVRQRGMDRAGETTSLPWVAPNGKAQARMLGMIRLRMLLRAQLRMERDPEAAPDAIEAHRKALKSAYDQFRKSHGFLNNQTNRRLFADDTDAPLVQALEFDYEREVTKAVAEKKGIEPSTEKATEADILDHRVLFPPQEVMNVATAQDALLASLNLKGRVDMAAMAAAYGKPEAEIVRELGDAIYRDPMNEDWQTADEYLSGDVKTKLEQARQAAKADSAYQRNVAALDKVIPKDKLPSEIYAGLGAGWIPGADVSAFAREISGVTSAKAEYLAPAATWLTSFDGQGDRELLTNTYGTESVSSLDILEKLLSGKPVEVKKRISDPTTASGERWVTDEAKTEEAKAKADKIKALWDSWLFGDPVRAERLASLFNDKFNRTVNRGFDGSHLSLPGMTPTLELRPHQKSAVWRGIQDRNILLDHVVGAGKTFVAVATLMEMKRLGIARKPIVIVPNHLTQQWKSDFARLYPAANVLAAEPEDFEKNNRQRLFSKIATGDWDAVVIGHSSLTKVGLDPEIEQRFLDAQVKELAEAIEATKQERGDRNIIRDMEKIKKNLDAKIADLQARAGEKDKVMTFNELGVDAMLVDEHHEFKNLFFTTQKQRVSGLGNPKGSGKAFDLFFKIRWLQETFGENAPLITATGTPVSNSLAEMFTMQRYMRYDELKRQGIHLFDAWANLYGSDEYVYEVAPSGVGYRINQRFAKFKNLPSLMGQYRQFADIVTLQDLKDQAKAAGKRFPVPNIAGGRPQIMVAQRSDLQRDFFGAPEIVKDDDGQTQYELQDPAEASIELNNEGQYVLKAPGLLRVTATREEAELALVTAALTPKVTVDPKSIVGQFENLSQLTRSSKGKINALSLTGLASKAGLDMRLIDPSYPDHPGSKINKAVGEMMRLYRQWAKDKGTQLVFCDLSVPASARKSAASQARRVYVRDDQGAITHKSGTLHTVEGRDGMPFYLVKETRKGEKGFSVYEAMTGQRIRAGLDSKADALAIVARALESEAKRDQWFDLRESGRAITEDEIAEYRDLKELESDGDNEISRDDLEASTGATAFSVYDDIKAKLMRQGVPESEIAFIHDYSTPKQKDALFKQVRRGAVRFLLGSTPKLGAGTNVQERLVGLHHIDAPWRPSDLEQREGRIIRQGNALYERDPDGFEVFIGRYATEQTYDTRRWQIIEHKAAGIEQLRKYSGELEIEDVGGEAANAADMKAASSGNPLILEETRLRNDVKRLTALQRAAVDAKVAAQSQKKWALRQMNEGIPALEREYQALLDAALPVAKDGKQLSGFALDGKKITDRETALAALTKRAAVLRKSPARVSIQYRGLAFELESDFNGAVSLHNPMGDRMAYWLDSEAVSASGLVTRLNNYTDALPSRMQELAAQRKKEQARIDLADKVMTEPFAEADALEATRARHAVVQRRLMKSSVMDAVPAEERVAFMQERESRKAELVKLGLGQAVGELETDEGEAKFSRSRPSGAGRPSQQEVHPALSREAVQAIAVRIRSRLGIAAGVKIRTVATEAELPKEILAQAAKEGATGEIIAVHLGDTIFLVADKHRSEARVEESILHEGTHYGANALFGRAKRAAYTRLYFKLGREQGVRDLAARLGVNMDSYFTTANDLRRAGKITSTQRMSYLVDELLAHLQGNKAYATLPQKIKTAIQEFFGAIRNWLRQNGFVELPKFSDADLAFLLKSLREATAGKVASGRNRPMFMVAWHGSPHDHDGFSLEHVGRGEGAQAQDTRLKAIAAAQDAGHHNYVIFDDEDVSIEAKFSRGAASEPSADQLKQEFDETRARYVDTPQWLKAPNGQPSNLNEQQWVQVRTPRFKAWFGDWEVGSALLPRSASTFDEARAHAKAFQGKPLMNLSSGMVAQVSRNTLDKMLNSKAVGKSETPALHAAAVANLADLFKRATLGWSKPDAEGDANIRAIHRFFAPAVIDGRAVLAKMTVKETAQGDKANPLYTVEAVAFDQSKNPAAQWVGEIASADGVDPRTIRSAGLIESMAQGIQDFNMGSVSKVIDENGEPMVVYRGEHGKKKANGRPAPSVPTTPGSGSLEDIGYWDQFHTRASALSFGSKSAANTYSTDPNNRNDVPESPRVYPAYLSISNPIINTPDDSFLELGDIVAALGRDEAVRIAKKFAGHIEGTNNWLEISHADGSKTVVEFLDKYPDRVNQLYFVAYPYLDDKAEITVLRNAGYDGAIHGGSGKTASETEYKVFYPTQIKSATGNTGAFGLGSDNLIQEPLQDDLFRQQLDRFLDSDPAGQSGPETEAARREAVAAVASLRGSGGTVLGARLADGFAARQRVSLVGHTVQGAEDVATLAQVYRDPRFETFRLLFVDDEGRIVSQVGLSSRLPASSAAIVGDDRQGYLDGLVAAAKQSGATGYYMLHNHPSGQARPSEADIALTQAFHESMALKNRGHVVIDTNEFALIQPDGQFEVQTVDFGAVGPLAGNAYATTKLAGPSDVMQFAKQLEVDRDAVTLVVVDSQLRVLGVSAWPVGMLRGSPALLKLRMRKLLKSMRGYSLFAVGRDRDVLRGLSDVVLDAVHVASDVSYSTLRGVEWAYGGARLLDGHARSVPRVSADTSPEFDYLRQQSLDARLKKQQAGGRVAEPGDEYAEPETRQPPAFEGDPEALFAEADALVANASRWQEAGDEFEKRYQQLRGEARRTFLGGLTVRQLVELGKARLPRMAAYLKAMTGMDVTRNEVLHEVDGIAKDWEQLDRQSMSRLAFVMHESTVAGVDGAEPYVALVAKDGVDEKISGLFARMRSRPGDDKAAWMKQVDDLRAQWANEQQRFKDYGRIVALYEALPEAAKRVYLKARDYHTAQSRRVEEALRTMIEQSEMSGRQKRAAMAKLREDFEAQRVNAPYFPLSRQGDYWVWAEPAGGGKAEFTTYQTIEEQDAAIEQARAQGMTLLGRGKQLQNLQQLMGVSGSFVAEVENLIGQLGEGHPMVEAVRDQVYQLYLQTLPDLSARKHFIHRKKTPGFGKDALRAFASKGYHDAYQYARLKHGFELRSIMENLREDIETATRKPKMRALKVRRADLLAFKAQVLDEGLSARKVKALAAALSQQVQEARTLAAMQGGELSPEHRALIEDNRQWKQFDEWMRKWARDGGLPTWVEQSLRDIELRIETSRKINADAHGHALAADVYDELQAAYAHLMNPQTGRWANTLNQMGYLWHLAFSPAAWVTNATQTPLITMPFVAAKHGMEATSKAFAKAYGEAFAGSARRVSTKEHRLGIREALTDADEIRAYEEAMARGLIERGRAMDLAGVAEEGASRSLWHRKFALAMAFGFHDAERLNRETTLMASYRLARDSGLDHEAAMDYADQVINETHFNYTAENRPRFLRPDLMRVLGQFKLYAQGVTYLQWRAMKQALGSGASAEETREARRFLLFQTAVQLAAGGVMGLPLGIWATGAVAQAGLAVEAKYGWKGALAYSATVLAAVALGGDDEDEPWDWKADFQQVMADWFGKTGGEVVSKGLVNAFAGVDLSSRVGQRELWWRELDAELDDRAIWGEVLSQAAGAGLGTVADLIQGLQMAAEGHIERGIEKMVPKVAKDAMQAARFAAEGAKTLKGDPLVESFGPFELAAKAAGFSPSRLAQRYDENRAEKNREQAILDRRSSLLNRIAEARLASAQADRAGDQSALGSAQADLKAALAEARVFGDKHPRLRIGREAILRSIQSRNRARARAQDGIFLNPKVGQAYNYAPE